MTSQTLAPWVALAERVPPPTMAAARDLASKHYRQFELTHGPAAARRAALAALAAASPPMRYEAPESVAPVVALAELLAGR